MENHFSSLGKEPEKIDLMRLLNPVMYMWRSIGEQLLLRHGDIMSIEYNPAYNDTVRLSQVIQLWIEMRPCEVSWRKIITVVKEPPINNVNLAIEICQFLSRPEIQNEYLSSYQSGKF